MSRADTCVTLTPGMLRSSSAKFWVGAFSSVTPVITLIVAGALMSVSSVRDALTTTVSSYLPGSSAGGCGGVGGCCAGVGGCCGWGGCCGGCGAGDDGCDGADDGCAGG